MGRNKMRWLCGWLVLCMLLGMVTMAMAEEETVVFGSADVIMTESEAEEGALEIGDLPLELDAAEEEAENNDVAAEMEFDFEDIVYSDEGEPLQAEVNAAFSNSSVYYGRVTAEECYVYSDKKGKEAVWTARQGDVVLVTGEVSKMVSVAIAAETGILAGYMVAADVEAMTREDVVIYQAEATAGEVVLYQDDVNWPLKVESGAIANSAVANAGNYTVYSNDTTFSIQGKSIKASSVANQDNCWTYANAIYNKIWDTNFASDFSGSAGAGWNMLRNLPDESRRLTADNLKKYVSAAQNGATIRITSCISSCSQWNNDGLKCGHKGHSLIIAAKDSDGVTIIDNHRADGVNYSVNTRYYSWQGFVNYWGSYTYIKYIKWPNAPVYSESSTTQDYSYKTLYKEDCTYKVIKAFNWHTGPASKTSTSGSMSVGDTFTTDAVIWNTTTNNMWVKKKGEEKYVFAGLHYANGKWSVDNSQTQYLSFVKNNSSVTWYNCNLQGTLEQGKSFALGGTLSSSATMLYAVGEFYKNKSCWGDPTSNISINSTSYTMYGSSLDMALKFGSLSEGDYSLALHVYCVADRGQKQSYTDIEKPFSIKATGPEKDNTAPTIRDVKISNLTSEGYTVTCTVSDNVGVTRVLFPTWYEGQQGEDATWHDGTISGTTATCQIKVSDHDNKRGLNYHTDIYAWDATGNRARAEARYNYVPAPDTSAPVITSIRATNVTSEGYTINCTFSDNVGVTSVKFPTWTEQNGQDDLVWHVGSLSGNTASYTVKVSDHKNERGCTYITHIYAYDAAGNYTCEEAIIQIDGDEGSEVDEPWSVDLDKRQTTMTAGSTLKLTASVTPTTAVTTMDWASSDETVAFVDSNGIVAAVSPGTATITVTTANGRSASCAVTVKAGVKPKKVKLNKTKATVVVGATLNLKAKLTPSNAGTTLTWTSSNKKVATVSDTGVVTAKAKGTAKITVKTANGKKATCKVTVPKAPKKIKFAKKSYSVKKGKTVQLKTKLTSSSAKTKLTWSSSDTKIATVNSKGKVKGKKKGTVKITVTTSNGLSATVKVKVK